jgi:hypothetical protein
MPALLGSACCSGWSFCTFLEVCQYLLEKRAVIVGQGIPARVSSSPVAVLHANALARYFQATISKLTNFLGPVAYTSHVVNAFTPYKSGCDQGFNDAQRSGIVA